MQKLYGANTSYHAGSDTYTLPGKNVSGTGWFTLWDADGSDIIQVPTGAGSATIDLRAATLAEGDRGRRRLRLLGKRNSGGFTIADGVVIENAVGGAGNDKLIGNAAANKLTGGGGQDILTGGDGPDIFIFANLSDFGGWSEARHHHGLHARYGPDRPPRDRRRHESNWRSSLPLDRRRELHRNSGRPSLQQQHSGW